MYRQMFLYQALSVLQVICICCHIQYKWLSLIRAMFPFQGGGVRGQRDFVWLGRGVRPHSGWRQTGTVCLFSGTCPFLRPQIRVQRWDILSFRMTFVQRWKEYFDPLLKYLFSREVFGPLNSFQSTYSRNVTEQQSESFLVCGNIRKATNHRFNCW